MNMNVRREQYRSFYGQLLNGVTILLAIFSLIITIISENTPIFIILMMVFFLGVLAAMAISSFLDYISNMDYSDVKIIIQTLTFNFVTGTTLYLFTEALFLSSVTFKNLLINGTYLFLAGFLSYLIIWGYISILIKHTNSNVE